MKKRWYDFLWIWTIIYFVLGFFNILFAWLGMIDFLVPLFIALFGGSKAFCNRYCGRGQLLARCGKCSRRKPAPRWLSSRWFRYGFLVCYDYYFYEAFANMARQKMDVIIGCSHQRTDKHSALEIINRFLSYNTNSYLIRFRHFSQSNLYAILSCVSTGL